MKRTFPALAILVAAGMCVTGVSAASADRDRGDHDNLAPRVFTLTPDPAANPEGIAFDGRSFYVSDTGNGTIYRGTLGRKAVRPFIGGAAGHSAVGMRAVRNRLYVAGGSAGTITVYNLRTKAVVASFATGSGGFLNDIDVTKNGDVYVTDSTRPTLWHVTAAQVAAGSGTPQALSVSPAITYQSGFNLNGLVQVGTRRFVSVQTNTGQLWRIDLARGGNAIAAITLVKGVSVPGGDGMIRDQGRLVVVQGEPPAQLSLVKLSGESSRGNVQSTRTSPKLRGPSSIVRASNFYLVVNADFATSTKPFTVVGLPREDNDDNDNQGNNNGDDHGNNNGDNHGNQGNGDNGNGDNGDNGNDPGDDNPGAGDGNGGNGGNVGAPTSAPPNCYYTCAGGGGGGGDEGSGGHSGSGGSGSGSGSGSSGSGSSGSGGGSANHGGGSQQGGGGGGGGHDGNGDNGNPGEGDGNGNGGGPRD